jgi:hypothetical protein
MGEWYCDACWPIYQAARDEQTRLDNIDCVGRYYRHLKTDGVYRVLACPALLERDGTDGPAYVVYESTSTNIVWIRIASEFFDGRFVDVTQEIGESDG